MADQRAQYNEEAVGANHPTKADVINRLALVEHGTDGVHGAAARASMGTAPLVLGSDADGDMYYRASSALARLAKGTANYKLFMNAGATAPEWAAGISYVSTSYNLTTVSGDQAITGAGFAPSGFIVLAGIADGMEWSVGFGVGPNLTGMQLSFRSDTSKVIVGSAFVHRIYMSAGYQNAVLKSWDADGVTLTWTKTNSPTGTLAQLFMFFR